MPESASIKAIQLVRSVFEHVHGNLGLLKFNIDELTPTNGTDTTESKKWDITCSFYETLGSTSPSKYKASVDLNTNTVSFSKIAGPTEEDKLKGTWVLTPKEKPDEKLKWMFLDLRSQDYDKDIVPFIKNGIIIDTSVFKIIVDGIVCTRISKKKSPEYDEILWFLDYIKVNNRWGRFCITPHILTEICAHLRNDYNDWENYKEIIKEILPILTEIEEKAVLKNEILQVIDFQNPIVEIGDISIFVVADNFVNRHIKIAILANDDGLNKKYQDSKDVMLLDYRSNLVNHL